MKGLEEFQAAIEEETGRSMATYECGQWEAKKLQSLLERTTAAEIPWLQAAILKRRKAVNETNDAIEREWCKGFLICWD